MKQKENLSCSFMTLIFSILFLFGIFLVIQYVPDLASQTYGSPNPGLNGWQRTSYAVRLLWHAGDLLSPGDVHAPEQVFNIQEGESVTSIATRLESAGLVTNADSFRLYLVWSGLDTSVQAGTYRLRPGQTGLEIAAALQDPSPTDATLVILPGWRMEEIAAALSSSGLDIAPQDFLEAATAPNPGLDILPAGATAEGFLFPGSYTLPRETSAMQLVVLLLSNFNLNLTGDLSEGFLRNGLDVYQAVTLASMIEREAVMDDEMAMIASVFYNRLAIGMMLESDPTVQYAIGYNTHQGTWWTNPLSYFDLEIRSPYNTYQNYGLPPAPIANPGLLALQAVAYPAQSPYYFFMARCDGSGWHNFAETFEEHSENLCP